MSDTPETTTLTGRYKDGYLAGRIIVTVGNVVKGIAFAIAGIIGVLSLLALQASALAAIGGFVLAAVVGGIFYLLGVLIAAQGQILQASLDVAVNSSPFLDNSQRADIMQLSYSASSGISTVSETATGTSDASYRCAICKETFGTRPSVFYHIQMFHKGANIQANIIQEPSSD